MNATVSVTHRSESWRRFTIGCLIAAAGALPFSHVPAQLCTALAALGWLGWSLTSRKAQVDRDVFLAMAGFYWVWNLAASTFSIRPAHSLAALVDNEWPAFLGLLIWWTVRSGHEIRRLLVVYFSAASVAFAYGIIQTFTGVEWIGGAALHQFEGGYYRSVGFSGFYLTFAGFAMSVFFLASGFALENPGSRWRWTVPILAVGAILGTYARSVWLAMALLVPLMAVLATTGKTRKWAFILSGIAILFVLAIEPLRDRAFSIVDFSQHETRLNLWKTSLAIARAHPILGIGQDNFTAVFEQFRVPGFYDTFVHPHNDYLSTLVHGGIPSLMAFLAMWGVVICKGWNTWRLKRGGLESWVGLGASVALAGFLLSALFQNYYGTFVNCFNWWLVTGLILSVYRLSFKANSSALPDHHRTTM